MPPDRDARKMRRVATIDWPEASRADAECPSRTTVARLRDGAGPSPPNNGHPGSSGRRSNWTAEGNGQVDVQDPVADANLFPDIAAPSRGGRGDGVAGRSKVRPSRSWAARGRYWRSRGTPSSAEGVDPARSIPRTAGRLTPVPRGRCESRCNVSLSPRQQAAVGPARMSSGDRQCRGARATARCRARVAGRPVRNTMS